MVICQVIYPRCTYTTRFVHMLKDRLCVYTFCIDEQFIPSDRWLPGCISTVSWRIKVRIVASYNRDLIKSNQPLAFSQGTHPEASFPEPSSSMGT